MPSKEEMKNLIISSRILEHNSDPLPDDPLPMLNTSSTSGYDGDEEDLGENMDSDEDEVMAWYDDEYKGLENKSNPEETPKNTPDEQHRERSTPSFLSPSWFQDVVNQSVLTSSQSMSLNGSRNASAVLKEHSSISTPANMHRRPLIDVNNRPHSSGSSDKRHAQFRPIGNTATSENMDMNY